MNKPRFNHCVLALLLSGAVLTAPSALALSAKRANQLRKAVTSVPVPEMPAKAAELVLQADKTDRKEVTITVVRAAVSKRKASGPVVVAAISKVAPDLAATAAAAASQLMTDQSANITQAAISAAPGQSEAILAAVATPITAVGLNQTVASQSIQQAQVNGNTVAAPQNQSVSTTAINSTVDSPSSVSGSVATASATTVVAATGPLSPTPSTPIVNPDRPVAPPDTPAVITATTAPIARGEADVNGPSSGTIGHEIRPINQGSGGRGDGNFPGFAPNRAPAPHPKDYSKPRS